MSDPPDPLCPRPPVLRPGPGPARLPGQLRHPPGQDHPDAGLARHGRKVPQRAGRLLQGRVSAALLRDPGLRRVRLRGEGRLEVVQELVMSSLPYSRLCQIVR